MVWRGSLQESFIYNTGVANISKQGGFDKKRREKK